MRNSYFQNKCIFALRQPRHSLSALQWIEPSPQAGGDGGGLSLFLIPHSSLKQSAFFLLLPALFLLASCTSSTTDADSTSKKKGKSISAPYELLVVCNKEWLGTAAAEPFNELLRTEVPALPQSEPLLRTTIINPSAFSGTFRFYANILRADISSSYSAAECRFARNVHCQPQLIATLTAPNQQAFDSLLLLRGETILQAFVEQELQAEAQRLRRQYSRQLRSAASEQFGIDIYAPKEIDAVKRIPSPTSEGATKGGFLWASSEGTEENYYNIVVYTYPLSPGEGGIDAFIAHRHEALAPNITAPTPGSYMSLDTTLLIQREVEVGGERVSEVRGLWQMEHAAMGGPFISHTYTDSLRHRALVAEAFVFAPGKDKRTFMRRLEAALRTIKVVND